MSPVKWVILIYILFSLFTLLNKGIRHLYLSILDDLYSRYFIRLNKRFYRVRTRDYFYAVLLSIKDLLIILSIFIFAPVIIIYHLPKRGYKYIYSATPYWKIKSSKPIKNEYIKPLLIFKIKKDIPFVPCKQQVIYFETSNNEFLNNYFSKEYQRISLLFKEKGYDFIYIPKLIESINLEQAKYSIPTLNKEEFHLNRLEPQDIYKELFSFIEIPTSLFGGLLRYKGDEEGYYIFSYYEFGNLVADEVWEQARTYLSIVSNIDQTVFYSRCYPYIEPDDNADYDFDSESKKLIDEIKERIEVLKQKGINELVLKSILSIESVKLSRLVVTKEYRIFLTDYNNLEIKMYPLPKAVFFLFLNYPQGILFKDLPDYRDELITIYKSVSGRENIEGMEKSIDDVVNPTLNSINEKCSRIREAFVKYFDESIAKNYFITGDRAKPKKIILDRSLVILENVDIKFDVVKTPFEYIKYEHPNNKYSDGKSIFKDEE